jgi:hypothetical protein
VIDGQGIPVTKNGKEISIDDLVSTFLEANPHFLLAGPGGAGSQGSGGTGGKLPYQLSVDDAKDSAKYRIAHLAGAVAGKDVEIIR